LIAACLAALLLASADLRADCPELVGRWPYGPVAAVSVRDGYAYIGSGTAVVVVDVSDPTRPVRVGLADTPDYVQDVTIEGSYAYVADGWAGLRIVDISNPSAPVEVGFYDTSGYSVGVAVTGRHAYVADYTEGLVVLDISNPQAPTEVGRYRFLEPVAISVVGSYAYTADGYGGPHILDVSDPSAPVVVGSAAIPDNARDLAVVGRYASLAAQQAGLRVVDVSSPFAPREVGSIEWPEGGFAGGVAVSGGYACLGCFDRFRVVDVSEPSVPVEVGSVATPSFSAAVTAAAGYVFLSNGGAGLSIFSECGEPSAAARTSFIPAAALAAGAQGAFFQTDVESTIPGRKRRS
jgi:hypothetical protein